MKPIFSVLALLVAGLAGCVAPIGPVEVTRFHHADVRPLARGTIAVLPAPGMDGASLEWRSYASAVAHELQRLGYSEAAAATGAHVALVSLSREAVRTGAGNSPISVGVGARTGSYGSGVGVGIGVNLSGPPPEEIVTYLSVTIRERASRQVEWEGRASFTVRATSPMADTQLGAPKLAEALFRDFPGRSGETILVE